jgi:hypothetical protein
MKNLYILKTEKPSRLIKMTTDNILRLSKNSGLEPYYSQHIYITNDEEIKEGDWVYFPISNEVLKIGNGFYEASLETVKTNENCKKIILTTDPKLIADGVQAIDDEFLEWFVKNPSCESVKLTDSKTVKEHIWDGTNDGEIIWEKEIIIPQEEAYDRTYQPIILSDIDKEKPKQETLEEGYICPQTKKQCDDECCVSAENCHIESSKGVLSEPKQETVEEADELFNKAKAKFGKTLEMLSDSPKQERIELPVEINFANEIKQISEYDKGRWYGRIEGAKWQEQRMYSEEDMIEFALFLEIHLPIKPRKTHKQLFEQFKKK